MIDHRKVRKTEPPKTVLEIAEAYNKLDDLSNKLDDLKITHNIKAALDELDVIMKALLHDEMVKVKAYSEDDYDTLPDAVWTGFASAHLKRHWRLGAQPK